MNRTAGRLGLEALVERPQKQRINPDQPASVLSLHERHSDLALQRQPYRSTILAIRMSRPFEIKTIKLQLDRQKRVG